MKGYSSILKVVIICLVFRIVLCSLNILAQQNAPRFNGASIIGNYPNTPFIFTVPISGSRPLKVTCDNLPNGLHLDEKSGILTGNILDSGHYEIKLKATNEYGTAEHKLYIRIGKNLLFAPIMGWNSWNVFAEDISEKLLLEIANALVSSGMRDMGYQYINLDDFWHGSKRDKDGKPTFDSLKFPNGMKYLADSIHSLGLKLGIYSCAGKLTCGEQFGGYGFEDIDAKSYAEWGVDLLKYDYCYAPYSSKNAKTRYNEMGQALAHTNRSIVFSLCEWGLRKPWKWGRHVGGHYWRITPDIFDVWEGKHVWHKSTESIVKKVIKVDKFAGVDSWNDMDMLIVGNNGKGKSTSLNLKYKGMTSIEYESHMILWCLFKSPLIAGCDIRTMNDSIQCILTKPEYLRINQDTLHSKVELLKKKNGVYIFSRLLSDGSTVVVVWNSKNKFQKFSMNYSNQKAGFNYDQLESPCTVNIKYDELSKTVDLLPHQSIVFILEIKF